MKVSPLATPRQRVEPTNGSTAAKDIGVSRTVHI